MSEYTTQAKIAQAKLIKTEIPVLLAKLVLNGERDKALELLIAWGTHQKDEVAIWNEAQTLLK